MLTACSNALRAALPAILPERRDASERRSAAISLLRVLWLARLGGLVTTGAGGVLTALGQDLLPPLPFLLGVCALVLLVVELLPSRFGHTRPEAASRFLALPLLVLRAVFSIPARLFLGPVEGGDGEGVEWAFTPPDFMWLEQRERGDQHDVGQERELMEGIVDFADKIVREVMVPRIDMVAMELRDDLPSVLREALEAGHSRFPVYRERIDDIVGVLYVKDLLGVLASPGEPFRMDRVLRQAYFVPEYKRIDSLFREFQSHRIHMAIVVDEYGGTAGIVTMEDLVEEVFGEILDEFDDSEAPMIQSLGSDAFRVDAMLPIDDLNELLDSSFESGDYDTVGGLVFSAIGKIPRPGEHVSLAGLRFTVEKVRAQRILLVKIAREHEDGGAVSG